MTTRRLLPLFLSLVLQAVAQDGQQLYTLYCSACHGVDGKGATGGTFPPLAGSPWVGGEAERSVKIVLKGLTGPVEVLGTTYNLEMPPQGAVLPDDQIAAILTYVRSAWGNQAGPVTAQSVAAIRAATEDRKTPWTAEEILKLHPLPLEKTALTNLISQTYAGKWSSLPDFSTLKAENVEEEHDGIITLADSTLKDAYAMLWQADFNAPAAGDYRFILDADDSARVILNGKTVAEVLGAGPMDGSRSKQGRIKLTAGTQKISVQYLEISGKEGIAIGWRGPGMKDWKWLSTSKASVRPPRTPIPITPVDGRPVIYRNFITGTTPRAIGVGFPGGVNLAWSADHLAPELVWKGNFIDGAPKWVERGTDQNPPAGEGVVKVGNSRFLPESARFRGYKLDPAGNPTFSVQIGAQFLLDSWRGETGKLTRKLSLSGSGAPLTYQISDLPTDSLIIEGAALESQAGKTTLTLTPGQPVTLTYRWK